MVAGPLREIAGRIEQFAGAEVSKKVMKGRDEMLAEPTRSRARCGSKKLSTGWTL